jgi:hypothetical protein
VPPAADRSRPGCTVPAFGQSVVALAANQKPDPQSAAPARDALPKDSRIGYVDLEKVAALSSEGKSATAQLDLIPHSDEGRTGAGDQELAGHADLRGGSVREESRQQQLVGEPAPFIGPPQT